MTSKDQQQIIKNAIISGDINMMQNVYIMFSCKNIKGIEELRQKILEISK